MFAVDLLQFLQEYLYMPFRLSFVRATLKIVIDGNSNKRVKVIQMIIKRKRNVCKIEIQTKLHFAEELL